MRPVVEVVHAEHDRDRQHRHQPGVAGDRLGDPPHHHRPAGAGNVLEHDEEQRAQGEARNSAKLTR